MTNVMTKLSEAKLEQNQNGSWNVMVRPVGAEDWLLVLSSTNKSMMQALVDRWDGMEMNWETEETE